MKVAVPFFAFAFVVLQAFQDLSALMEKVSWSRYRYEFLFCLQCLVRLAPSMSPSSLGFQLVNERRTYYPTLLRVHIDIMRLPGDSSYTDKVTVFLIPENNNYCVLIPVYTTIVF